MNTFQSCESTFANLENKKRKKLSPYYRRSSLPQDKSSYSLLTVEHFNNFTFVNKNAVIIS